MPIQLLPKSEVNRLQAKEKQMTIDEGVKLANRIERLRVIAATEEASLASFRSNTVKAIQEEITILNQEKNSLSGEVLALREEIRRGTSALTEREVEINKRLAEIEEQKTILKSRSEALQELALGLSKSQKANTDYENRLILGYKVLSEMEKATHGRYTDAHTLLSEAENKAQRITVAYDELEEDLRARDIAVASRERDVTIKEERLINTEKALEEQAIAINDRYETLLKTEQEVKNRK